MSRNPFPMSIRRHMLAYREAQVTKLEDAIAAELQHGDPSDHILEHLALRVARAEEYVAAMQKAIAS